eukprot:GGOE01001381.1.p1 GENE.GGOE01001381.1~~GGOE01001381.1.p1  ORF type:complete len:579 (+),score=172.54 GGOE01001381.1:54-1739(+)
MSTFLYGGESLEEPPVTGVRRASLTIDPLAKPLEPPPRPDTRRKSMPAGLTELEALSPTAAAAAAARFLDTPKSPEHQIMEDISSVTIKARRISINAMDPRNTEPSNSVTLKLRRMNQKGRKAGMQDGQLSLSASSNNREQVILTGPPTAMKGAQMGSVSPLPSAGAGVEDDTGLVGGDGDAEEREELFYLENEWSFWFDETAKKQTLIELGSFNTVQGFWAYWNNLNVGIMRDNCNLSLFKKGTKPVREDPMNREGGRWVVSDLPKNQRVKFWSKMVMLMIGEQLDDDSDNIVCGALFVTREGGDMMQLWVDGGYAVRTRGQEVVKPNLGQARQPMVEILHSLFPPGSTYRWVHYPASDPLPYPGEPEPGRTSLRSEGSMSSSFRHKDALTLDTSMMGSSEDHRGVPTPSSSRGMMSPSSRILSTLQSPAYMHPAALAKLSSIASEGFQVSVGSPMGNPIRSPECLSPGMPLSRESTTPVIDPGIPPDADPADLELKMEEALRSMNVTLDGQRRMLQQKVVQISCLLSIFEQVQQRPADVASSRLSDLIQLHLAQSYPGT